MFPYAGAQTQRWVQVQVCFGRGAPSSLALRPSIPVGTAGKFSFGPRSRPEVALRGVSVDGKCGMGPVARCRLGALLAPILIASQSSMYGRAGTSPGIGVRPVVSLCRSSGVVFVRAVVPLGMLLGDLEEFYSTENFVAAFKAQRPRRQTQMLQQVQHWSESGSSLLPFPPLGKRWLSSLHGRDTVYCLFFQRKSSPYPGFLGHSWTSVVPHFTSFVGREDLWDGKHLARGSEEDARGPAKVRRERL